MIAVGVAVVVVVVVVVGVDAVVVIVVVVVVAGILAVVGAVPDGVAVAFNTAVAVVADVPFYCCYPALYSEKQR